MKECFQLHSKENSLTLYNYVKDLENLDKLRDKTYFVGVGWGFFMISQLNVRLHDANGKQR